MNTLRSQPRNFYGRVLAILTLSCGIATNATADAPFFFSTGNPDGLIATLARAASPGKLETETADDFITPGATTLITDATFVGLVVTPEPTTLVLVGSCLVGLAGVAWRRR